ncbi:MAG: alpha/beta hydrolase [Thermoguttaceae bacterium]
MIAILLLALGQTGAAEVGQGPRAVGPTKPKPKESDEEMPPPVELRGSELVTRDGMLLRATFYPSPNAEKSGKDVVPVILLHGHPGDRTQFQSLAEYLQQQGHAVLVPDLRWHGESNEYRDPPAARDGAITKVERKNVTKADFENMYEFDVERLKKFLLERNDAGELNMEKLCIVGSEIGALIALNWAMNDWSWPPLGGKKQGQYVKGLVLISPSLRDKGLDATAPLRFLGGQSMISFQILVGKQDPRATKDAQRIKDILEKLRPPPEEPTPEKMTVWFKGIDSKLQGTKMLGVRGLDLEKPIAGFIQYRLADQDFKWQESKRKP